MARVLFVLALLCSAARADGPYVSWGMSAWWAKGPLAAKLPEGDATFQLLVGMRVREIAVEAWTAPAIDHLGAEGVDVKYLGSLGRYISPYARLRLARMTLDVDGMHGSGLGVGLALGVQAQFPAHPFGLLIPAWFGAPAGPRKTGGIYVEVADESYAVGRFWRLSWGLAWGGAF
jgi:hypothetical protein